MKRMFLLLTSCLLMALFAHAQDQVYSQFYNSPVYLNPALTGQFEGDFRVNMIYRNQWSAIPGSLNYLTATVDYSIPKFGGGVGLLFSRSSEGTAYYTKNNVAGTYSYSVGSNNYVLSFGMQIGATNRVVDYSKLIFEDQIDPKLGYMPTMASSAEAPQFSNKYYFDSGAGVNLVAGNFMSGVSMQHLNRPDESFTGTKSTLPIRTSAYVSYRFDLNPFDNYEETEKSYIIPSVVFYKQGDATAYNAGFQYKRHNVSAGLWYRTSGQSGPSAVVVSFIFDLFINKDTGEKLRFGLSHDATTSTIGYANTNGTSEGSLSYETPVPYRYNNYNKFDGATRCYNFY
jgi:type IX secretion system PorP/SprF family membrane protein